MLKWMLVSDSACDISINNRILKTKLGIAPLKIEIDGVEYQDDENCNSKQLLESMKKSKAGCSTSCPTIEEFAKEFLKADNIICVVISSKLSGSYNMAMQAKKLVQEGHPEKKIHVVDSLSASGALLLVLMRADELINQGLEFEEIAAKLEEYRDGLGVYFSLAKFDNFVRSGRMSKATGLMATALNIRAVAKAENGFPMVVAKPHGEKNAIIKMAELIKSDKNLKDETVVVTHCNNPLGAKALKAAIEKLSSPKKIMIVEGRGLTTYYANDQGLIVVY